MVKPFAPSASHGTGSDPVTLIIGDMDSWTAQKRELPVMPGLSFVDVDELNAAMIANLAPDIVMSPLFVRDIDVVEIARRLVMFGFSGRYRIVADDIPNDSVLQDEVSAVAPGIDFAIISLPMTLFGN